MTLALQRLAPLDDIHTVFSSSRKFRTRASVRKLNYKYEIMFVQYNCSLLSRMKEPLQQQPSMYFYARGTLGYNRASQLRSLSYSTAMLGEC